MREREPALYHLYVGQYLERGGAREAPPGEPLSGASASAAAASPRVPSSACDVEPQSRPPLPQKGCCGSTTRCSCWRVGTRRLRTRCRGNRRDRGATRGFQALRGSRTGAEPRPMRHAATVWDWQRPGRRSNRSMIRTKAREWRRSLGWCMGQRVHVCGEGTTLIRGLARDRRRPTTSSLSRGPGVSGCVGAVSRGQGGLRQSCLRCRSLSLINTGVSSAGRDGGTERPGRFGSGHAQRGSRGVPCRSESCGGEFCGMAVSAQALHAAAGRRE